MSVRRLVEVMREEVIRRLSEERSRRKEFIRMRVLLPKLREKRERLEGRERFM